MLKKEFTDRTGIDVTIEQFEPINKIYMATDLDKDEFCRLYKSEPELLLLYGNACDSASYFKNKVKELGCFMAGVYAEYGIEDLKDKAIDILGPKEYIKYKLSKGFTLTQEDKEIITALLG